MQTAALSCRANIANITNISWRQQVGGSAIEASKMAGHSDVDMTADYTFVDLDRQKELTLAIQRQLAKAAELLVKPS